MGDGPIGDIVGFGGPLGEGRGRGGLRGGRRWTWIEDRKRRGRPRGSGYNSDGIESIVQVDGDAIPTRNEVVMPREVERFGGEMTPPRNEVVMHMDVEQFGGDITPPRNEFSTV